MKNGFRRKGNRLEYRFTHCGKQYSVSGATEKECKAKAQKRIVEASKGLKTDAKNITWEQYAEEWLKAKSITVKSSTMLSYRKKLKMVNIDKKMQTIDRRDILSLQADLAVKYSSSTVNWLMTMLRHIFDSAIADGIIIKNPASQIKSLKRTEPKATDTIHRALSKKEQTDFLGYAHDNNLWYTELFEFMLATGVRVGEAGALRWEDVNSAIQISKTIARTVNGYVIQSTKTEAGNRTLPLTPSAKEVLIRQKIKVMEHKGIAFTAPDQFVFYGFNDESCINPSKVDSAISYICDKIKMPRFTSHAFRDTYATRCIQQGMQPNTLKKLMGHTKIAITMNIYAQVHPEDMEEAMARISIL